MKINKREELFRKDLSLLLKKHNALVTLKAMPQGYDSASEVNIEIELLTEPYHIFDLIEDNITIELQLKLFNIKIKYDYIKREIWTRKSKFERY